MPAVAQIPRSRGVLCGILLVLLGAWGALVPFVGPYFHFAYTPDRAWAYTAGRLYLSVIPGAAAALGGLLMLITRSRAVGVLSGFLAALGGAWFIVGYAIILVATKSSTINPGVPVGSSAAGAIPTIRQTAEELGFFYGLGVMIVFVCAVAIGRFSVIAAKDTRADTAFTGLESFGLGQHYPASSSQAQLETENAPTSPGVFPSSAQTVESPRPPSQGPPPEHFPPLDR
jgi:hypothetical protein